MWKRSCAIGSLCIFSIPLLTIAIPVSNVAPPTEIEREESLWVLLHGIWPGSGRDWRYVASVLSKQGQTVLRPTLPGRAGLFPWANNIVQFFEEQGLLDRADKSVRVVAHSFAGAAVLFLLRTAYELNSNTLADLQTRLDCAQFLGRAAQACREIEDGWSALLADSSEAQRWMTTAQKIERVFLYHPALQGACGTCLDFLGFGGGTTASLCLLSELGSFFFSPIAQVTWAGTIPIVNLYGGMDWMLSLCGLRENDFALSRSQQLLRLPDESGCYREIFSGSHMHFAFAVRRSVGRELAQLLHELAQAKEICGGTP